MVENSETRVFAAGSLRAPLTAIATDFEKTGTRSIRLTFGPSGLLCDRIVARGEVVDVFASANMEHPQWLTANDWSSAALPFARNELCVLAAERVPITSANVLDMLLDPRWKLGTSTPKLDPSGDYAWELFRRADALRPGAFSALDSAARKLVGGSESSPSLANRSIYAMLIVNGDADLFLTYSTNAQQAVNEVPTLTVVRLPDNLRIAATYGLAVRTTSSPSAQAFAEYVLSPAGQETLARFGFAPP